MLSAVQISEISLQKFVQDVSEELHLVCNCARKSTSVLSLRGREELAVSSPLALQA